MTVNVPVSTGSSSLKPLGYEFWVVYPPAQGGSDPYQRRFLHRVTAYADYGLSTLPNAPTYKGEVTDIIAMQKRLVQNYIWQPTTSGFVPAHEFGKWREIEWKEGIEAHDVEGIEERIA